MASVLLGIDDPQVGQDIVTSLEEAGHHVKWVPALDVTPGAVKGTPDALLVDADAPGMNLNVVHASWRKREPPPAMVVLGSTQKDRMEAERLHARFLPKPVSTEQIRTEMARLSAGSRGDHLLSSAAALRALGLVGGGLPEDEAALIVAGARSVDVTHVREALRPHIFDYAMATRLVDRLCQRRTLGPEEARLAMSLDGGHTIRGAIDGLPRSDDDTTPVGALSAHQAARLLWALASSGSIQLSKEPPPGHATARLRAHVRTRRAMGSVTHYQILEVGLHGTAAEVDRAFYLAQLRYGAEVVSQHDLAELLPAAAQVWTQIQRAYSVLGNARLRIEYDNTLVPRPAELEEQRERRRYDAEEAERTFLRGQQFLAQGDVFRAMSELAAAARRFPAQPEYDAYAAWARLLADEERGGERRRLAERERPKVEAALAGRRLWPRAAYVLALLCEAAGDLGSAADHLREAITGDDKLTAARQALQRIVPR